MMCPCLKGKAKTVKARTPISNNRMIARLEALVQGVRRRFSMRFRESWSMSLFLNR